MCVEDKIVHQHDAQTILRGIKNGYILSPYLPAQNLDQIESIPRDGDEASWQAWAGDFEALLRGAGALRKSHVFRQLLSDSIVRPAKLVP